MAINLLNVGVKPASEISFLLHIRKTTDSISRYHKIVTMLRGIVSAMSRYFTARF
jgi:hypothetical protein